MAFKILAMSLFAAASAFAAALPEFGTPAKGKYGLKLVRMPEPKDRQWTVHEGATNIAFDAELCRRQLERTGAAWWSEKTEVGSDPVLTPSNDSRYGMKAWLAHAKWPIPSETRMQFAEKMKRRISAGESVVVEIGVDADGRINPVVAKYLESVAWINRGESEPSPATLNPSMTHIQRTMKALEESTAENPAHVKVFFYGQSIVAEGWTEQLANDLRARYPTAKIEYVKKAIGGFQAEKLHDCAHSDMYPEYPDIVFFHDYGLMNYYEEMVRFLRERTTAEIVLWTSHLSAEQPIDRNWKEPQNRSAEIRRIAQKYGCAIIELREKWIDMLESAGWLQRKPLCDTIHHGQWGQLVYGRMIGEELYRIPGESGHPDITGKWRDYPVSAAKRLSDGSIEMAFDGNRVDAFPDGTGKGAATVWIDGIKATDIPEIWTTTRPSNGPRWMPAIRRVFLGEGILPRRETWTLTLPDGVETNGWACGWNLSRKKWPTVLYTLSGSVTGSDGEGNTTTDFTSRSGRIVLPWPQMDFINQCSGFRKPLEKGYKVTWDVYPQCADPYDCASTNRVTTLVQAISNAPHTLRLKPEPGSALGIRSLRVYTPSR